MADDPHFIHPAERAKGEPGEGGCPRAEAEEREAEKSAPDILAAYYALVNPPPDLPTPSPARMDMVARGEWPHGARRHLKAHFDQALRREEWICFAFDEKRGERVRVHAPWLKYDDKGEMTYRYLQTYSEVLFYRVGTKTPALPPGAPAQEKPDKDLPRDTSALRLKAKTWLAQFVADDKHVDRDDTLKKMRAKHPGLGVRGSLSVFRCYSAEYPELKLSAPGRKSKRNTNN